MKPISHSKGTGALILLSIVIVFCFVDTGRILSFYRTHVQPALGKTHFIVGGPRQQRTITYDQQESGTDEQAVSLNRILFAPDDDIQQELIKLIDQEQESIKIAIFTFTDKEVAQALIDAHNRGVHVEVVTDAAYLRDQYSKIALLQSNKIPIFTYNPHYQNAGKKKQEMLSIMHNKFVVFGKNAKNMAIVWTGSFNFTRSAKLRNQENVVILYEQQCVKKFTQQFHRLKKRCDTWYEHDGEGMVSATALIPSNRS